MSYVIVPAATSADLAEVARLFRAYAAGLPVDLAYQDFEGEVRALPGRYAPPGGALLLARAGGAAAGCVGMRPLEAGVSEMKRLYVVPEARGQGFGEALVAAVIAAAETAGHGEMRLDTLPTMEGALALYRRHGFTETAAYYETPVAGTIFMRRKLGPPR